MLKDIIKGLLCSLAIATTAGYIIKKAYDQGYNNGVAHGKLEGAVECLDITMKTLEKREQNNTNEKTES